MDQLEFVYLEEYIYGFFTGYPVEFYWVGSSLTQDHISKALTDNEIH